METPAELQQPDEFRPSKRVRLEAPLTVTEGLSEELDDEEGWDDIYGGADNGAIESRPLDGADTIRRSEAIVSSGHGDQDSPSTSVTLPDVTASPESVKEAAQQELGTQQGLASMNDDGVPPEAIDDGDELVPRQQAPDMDSFSARVLEDTAEIEVETRFVPQAQSDLATGSGPGTDQRSEAMREPGFDDVETDLLPQNQSSETMQHSTIVEEDAARPDLKPLNDSEFLAAAETQRGNEEAEWQFDPSDAGSSSDSDSDSSSDDDSEGESVSGSEDGYEMLDPATMAKILMSGDGEDGDGEKGKDKAGTHHPRTANEVAEDAVTIPDVKITEDMTITFLGTVDHRAENMILIKAATPGEYQVVEAGSVLCKEDRKVIGAVAETLGRVQEPLYSVAFTSAKDIEEAGLEIGTKMFYVNDHSTFVFTQPLRNMKGTDASNIHDEEVGEDEIEFSDDEKEAEYKRMKKLAKRGGRGGLSRSAFNAGERLPSGPWKPYNHGDQSFLDGNDAPHQQYGGGMKYDDEDAPDEFYSPLKRPENLSQLMANGGPSKPHQRPDRGKGGGRGDFRGRVRGDRGHGRGRIDRGRGRGGFAHRSQKGKQANQDHDAKVVSHNEANGHRGNAHSFPDRHNDELAPGQKQHTLPPKPAVPQPSSRPPQLPPYNQYHQSNPAPAPAAQTYQFNGYTFQYGNASSQLPASNVNNFGQNRQQPTENLSNSILPGAHVNPAFFQSHPQQAQWQQNQWHQTPQPQQQQNASWTAPQQQVYQQYAQQNNGSGNTGIQPQYQPSNLADILRNLGGQPQ